MCFPFTASGSTSRYSTIERVQRYVSSPTRIASSGASDWRRDAVFTTSPATIPSPSVGFASRETIASPVLTARRMCRSSSGSFAFMSAIPSRIAKAARTARSGSSPWTRGAPKTAITASPMNFSTVPPKASISKRRRAKYGCRIARTSSGSRRSARLVNPAMSTKSTVTTRRSSVAARCGFACNAAPHWVQKLTVKGLVRPHAGQTRRTTPPQDPQKR